jgi:hypothetical protein
MANDILPANTFHVSYEFVDHEPAIFFHELLALGNFNHGSWQSGDKKLSKAEALAEYLKDKDLTYFESLSESISFDRQLPMVAGTERIAAHLKDFLAAKSVRNRTEFDLYLRLSYLLEGCQTSNHT